MIVVHTDKNFGTISLQKEHQRVALQLARKFGAHTVQELKPRGFMEYTCGHLSDGWPKIEAACPLDSKTGLPQDFRNMDFLLVSRAWSSTVETLTNHHPFCGLLASLFFCRFSEHSSKNWQSDPVRAFIDAELTRQRELNKELNKAASTAQYTDPKLLGTCTQQLEFIQTFALVLIDGKSQARNFSVPGLGGEHTDISLQKVAESAYSLSPSPFFGNKIEVCIRRFSFPRLTNETDLNYKNILPELDQHIETVQILTWISNE